MTGYDLIAKLSELSAEVLEKEVAINDLGFPNKLVSVEKVGDYILLDGE